MPLKVAIVTPRLHGIGGVAQHTRKLAKWLKKRGHSVEVVTAPYLPVKNLSNPSALVTLATKVLAKRIARKLEADIVHIHHIMFYLAGKMSGKPIVLTLHGDVLKQYSMLHPWAKSLVKMVEKTAVMGSDRITAVSPLIAERYMCRYGKDVYYVPNAIDLADIPMDHDYKDEKTVVYLGRLSFEKGIDILLKTAKILDKLRPEIKIVVVGDGPLRNEVISYSQKYNNIIYLGFRPRTEALRILSRSTILVLPSRAEGFPTVILEAFACRTVVVAVRIPEIRALFTENEVAFVNMNPIDIANAIQYLIDNHLMRKRLAMNAYNILLTRYTWGRVVNEYIKVYHNATRHT